MIMIVGLSKFAAGPAGFAGNFRVPAAPPKWFGID
jgi:hypothetical protein